MTTRKGVLPTDADLNDYGTNDDHGVWAGRATNVLNAPPAGNVAAVFEVWVGAQANGVVQRWSTDEASWWREKVDSSTWGPWLQYATMDDIPVVDGLSQFGYDDDGTPFIADGAGPNPQPPSRRLVTEQRLSDDKGVLVSSSAVRRIVVSDDASEPLAEGDLLLVYVDEGD